MSNIFNRKVESSHFKCKDATIFQNNPTISFYDSTLNKLGNKYMFGYNYQFKNLYLCDHEAFTITEFIS